MDDSIRLGILAMAVYLLVSLAVERYYRWRR